MRLSDECGNTAALMLLGVLASVLQAASESEATKN